MSNEELEIVEIVNRETKAWDSQDVKLLISIFHPDVVWPWPKTPNSHDPMDWEMVLGRFNKDNNQNQWKGRVCKVYSKVGSEWKMSMHTGVLEY